MPSINNTEARDVTFDKWGRMNFHPDFHAKQGTPWTMADQNYLIESYEALGPEQTAMALERTIHTVMQRACELRKKELMAKRTKGTTHKRLCSPKAA